LDDHEEAFLLEVERVEMRLVRADPSEGADEP
jgi:hypothetical protein